jgi:hypothetical protein
MKPDDRQHIEAICRRHNIHLITPEEHAKTIAYNTLHNKPVVTCSCNATNADGQFGIWLNPEEDGCPNEDAEYYSALHEIAHCVLRHMDNTREDGAPTENMVQLEIEAWEWAFGHAQYWPNEEALLWMLNCLASYSDEWALTQQLKKQQMKDNEKYTELLKAKGFSEQEAKNIQNNLHALSVQVSMLDLGLRTLNVPVLRTLNNLAKQVTENNTPELASMGLHVEPDKVNRLDAMCDLAEKYQTQFGSEDQNVPEINVTTRKPITA